MNWKKYYFLIHSYLDVYFPNQILFLIDMNIIFHQYLTPSITVTGTCQVLFKKKTRERDSIIKYPASSCMHM